MKFLLILLAAFSLNAQLVYGPSGVPFFTGGASGVVLTGHPTIEGVTSTGATGTGLLVFGTSPVFTTPNLGTPSAINLTNATSPPTWNQNTSGTAANLSGTPALPNGTTGTTQSQADGSTKLATTNYVDTGLATKAAPPAVLISTSGPVSDPGGNAVFQFNNASGVLTFNLPVGVAGMQRCYRNATGKTGIITVAVTTSNVIDLNGANGTTSTGTLVSTGALGDAVCLTSDAANHWYAYTSSGNWTNN